jgi:hypothetical protein
VDLAAHYAAAEDVKSRVMLAAELRLTESALARLLKQVATDIPAPESQVTIKARRAAISAATTVLPQDRRVPLAR